MRIIKVLESEPDCGFFWFELMMWTDSGRRRGFAAAAAQGCVYIDKADMLTWMMIEKQDSDNFLSCVWFWELPAG